MGVANQETKLFAVKGYDIGGVTLSDCVGSICREFGLLHDTPGPFEVMASA